MSAPVASIRNLGPAMAAAFARAGITEAQTLHTLGADVAYARLLECGAHRPHFMAYTALALGLQGRPFSDCTGPEKSRLRARFDAICADATPIPIDSALDALGVVPARPRKDTR